MTNARRRYRDGSVAGGEGGEGRLAEVEKQCEVPQCRSLT